MDQLRVKILTVELTKVVKMTNLSFPMEILYIYDSVLLGIRVIFKKVYQ